MNPGQFIIPLGISTYFFLLLTVISGFRRWKLKVHIGIAITALVLASIHAGIVLFLYL